MKQHWIDNQGGLFMSSEQSMRDLVTNGYIKSFKLITEAEFKKLLVEGDG